MLEMAAEDADWRAELERALTGLDRDLKKLQEEALFTGGRYDSGPAVVSVHAGAGGTDSQDWPRCCFACTCDGPRRAA